MNFMSFYYRETFSLKGWEGNYLFLKLSFRRRRNHIVILMKLKNVFQFSI